MPRRQRDGQDNGGLPVHEERVMARQDHPGGSHTAARIHVLLMDAHFCLESHNWNYFDSWNDRFDRKVLKPTVWFVLHVDISGLCHDAADSKTMNYFKYYYFFMLTLIACHGIIN